MLPYGVALAGTLLVAAAVIALAGRWRRAKRSVTTTASEQLSDFRSLYEKGEMSREEFERIRAHLTDQIRGTGPTPTAPETTPAVGPATPTGPTASTPPSAPPAPAPPAVDGSPETPTNGVAPPT